MLCPLYGRSALLLGFLFRNAVLFFEARSEALQIDRVSWLRAFRSGPEILHRPRDWLLQFSGCLQRPIGIAQEFAGHDHCIRLSRPNNVLRLDRRRDKSDGAGHDSRFAADPLGKGRLVTGTDRNFAWGTFPPEEQSIRSTPICFNSPASLTDS